MDILSALYWLPRLARFLREAARGELSLRTTRRRELGDDRVATALAARDGYIPEATVSPTQMSPAPAAWPESATLPRRRSATDSTDKGPNGRLTRKP
ncbi:hypothetical protein METY_2667 [Methylopila sp. Yamaguchi]|nr:hypothetical protein METY_2667 [Methylopila sp. Yamaguchi]